jgi:tripartite-type tricarboxylate transporter receptor subunit TctC
VSPNAAWSAAATVGRAAPDGHTPLVGSGDGIVISDVLYGRAQGPLRPRLRPVTVTITASQLLVTHPGGGIRTVEGYVARARRGQGVTLGIPGHGSTAHLISGMLNRQVGEARVVHVPCRGGGPATLDLLAGQIDAMIITLPAVADHVRAGRLRRLAVSTLRRDPAMPEVPSLAEAVAPGFDVPSTQGVLVPAAAPDAAVEAWHLARRARCATPR